ncbi:MAG TPA: zinc ABC transporter substrate-binding protein [Mycobacteriales bacterium]|nr:zinc ABC transporter substrate-binding protein [Mycobacteriales bacterium]
MSAVALWGAAGCSSSSSAGSPAATGTGSPIVAVGAENEYANVIAQIGGKDVTVSAVESNPNTDPHTFEASPQVAEEVSKAQLVVQNGVGYDTYMNKIESAAPNSSRKVIDVQTLLGLPDSTPNPHLWYKPTTMPAVAKQVAADLSSLRPAQATYFQANVTKFDDSLKPWLAEIAKVKSTYPSAPVAATEPVGDYMLEAAGTDNLTPFTLQAAIMNGTDPSPQNVTLQNGLFTNKKVKVFVYNQQVTDSITQSFLKLARQNDVPVLGVYETMPTPGYTYQSWMLAETTGLYNALRNGTSTTTL